MSGALYVEAAIPDFHHCRDGRTVYHWRMKTSPRISAKNVQVDLPKPVHDDKASLSTVLQARRSVRHFRQDGIVTLEEVSRLLWSAQGVSSPPGYRTSPSAGALYPLEVYLVVRRVPGLEPGIYHYDSAGHLLICTDPVDRYDDLVRAALHQNCVRQSAVVLAISAVARRTTVKYGRRGTRYIHMEAGHTAQNVLLTAASLNLGAVPVGAFEDSAVARVLNMYKNERPLYLIPVGQSEPATVG